MDATEYGLVTRFGRVVRVISEPGLYVTAPFDRVVRLDKRVLFFRPARSEYLTIDKKNVVVESLATWRIADPERFLGTFTTQAAAEQLLGDVILAEIGSVIGHYPASDLVSADPAESRYRPILSAIGRRVADFARPAYGIDVISLDIRRLSLPEQNRDHVFDRMKAERAKIAKENRSAGELAGQENNRRGRPRKGPHRGGSRGRGRAYQAEGDAEASRTTRRRSGRIRSSTNSSGPCRPTRRSSTTKRHCFFPRTRVLRLLHFDAQPAPASRRRARWSGRRRRSPPQEPSAVSADADRLLKKKSGEELR